MIRLTCALYCKLKGWRYENNTPTNLGSFVALGAPHTSNWDFITSMAILFHTKKVKSKYILKKSLMKWPFGYFFSAAGGIAIDREAISQNAGLNTTDTFSEMFHQKKRIALWLSPEGTRDKREQWKSGFYYIAQKAKVPLVLAYADWKTKTFGLGEVIHLTDNIDFDMKRIAEFYSKIQGKIPENFSVDLRYLDHDLPKQLP